MKRPFSFHLHQSKSAASLFGLALFFLLFVLGCSRGGEEAPPAESEAAAAQQQATLTCNEECAARGQCGTLANGGQSVILGHPDYPAVQDHQMTFQAEYTLPIVGTKDELVQTLSTDEQFSHTFYLLQRADERVGWVAGWCVTPQ